MSKFASLTSGLLARKGLAEPAATLHAETVLARVDATGPDFRTQGAFGRRLHASAGSLLPARELGLELPVVGRRCDERSGAVGTQSPDVSSGSCPDVCDDPDRTFHVSLRLKRKRFVQLKLSAALLRRPTQEIVGEALDLWFERLPSGMLGDCPCIRGR